MHKIGALELSLYALTLIVIGSLGYAGTDLLRKLLMARMRPLPLLFYVTAGPAPLFAAWVAWEGGVELQPGYLLPGGTSMLLNVVANLAFLEALRRSPLSATIPYLSFTPVFTTLLAVPLLGERPTAQQLLGVAVVVAGAYRMSLSSAGRGRDGSAWALFWQEKGSVLMVGVALVWSLAVPLDKLAMASASPAFHGLALNLGIAVATLLTLVGQGRTAELRVDGRQWALVLLLVLLSMAALAVVLVALTVAWAGAVETFRRAIGSVLALLLGRWVFGEPITLAKAIAVGLMTLGVALIFL